MNKPDEVRIHDHQEAWESYLEAERRELQLRKEGHLAKMLDGPLPDEPLGEVERLAEEDRQRALEGLVELKSDTGTIIYKALDELTPEDRAARIRAEGDRVSWIMERRKKRRISG